jgi:glycosyl transferase family WbsX
MFVVFRAFELPDPLEFTTVWRKAAADAGLSGMHLVGLSNDGSWDPEKHGFDASIVQSFSGAAHGVRRSPLEKITRRLRRLGLNPRDSLLVATGRPTVYDYAEVDVARVFAEFGDHHYPCVVPNWDNTPRSERRGVVLHGATPERFQEQLRRAVHLVEGRSPERRIVFIKAWNEWAEGNHLEPDRRFGRGWLEAVRDEICAPASEAVRQR